MDIKKNAKERTLPKTNRVPLATLVPALPLRRRESVILAFERLQMPHGGGEKIQRKTRPCGAYKILSNTQPFSEKKGKNKVICDFLEKANARISLVIKVYL